MKMKPLAGVLALLFFFFGALPALAMRCQNGLVTSDSTKLDVLNACGEPQQKFGDSVVIGDTGVSTGQDEKWVYDIGGGVYHIVYFDGFDVRKIEIEQK
jgi:hypothetical protein